MKEVEVEVEVASEDAEVASKVCELCVAYGGYCGSCDGSCWS